MCIPAKDAACVNPGGQAGARRRFRRIAAHRSVWNPLVGGYVDIYTNPA
jgi:hypothetical protein